MILKLIDLAGRILKSKTLSKLNTGVWRGGLVIVLVVFAYGMWSIYSKVDADMVTKDAFAKSCEDTDEKIKKLVNQVTDVVTDLKEEIVGYRKDLQTEKNDRIKFLESELEKSRRHRPGSQ